MKPVDETKCSLRELANAEALVWEDSPYYTDAETWTWLFWSDAHWFRRLFDRLDLTKVLELACGRGRHAEYLLEHLSDRIGHLTIMDILESNTAYCRKRIGYRSDVSIIQSTGSDFRPVEDASVTAIYCYDAMVHFDYRVVQSYVKDAFRVLAPGGRALFHHSNYSIEPDSHFGTNPLARAFMSAPLFRKYADEAGLQVVEQVIFPWGGIENLDCISLIEKSH